MSAAKTLLVALLLAVLLVAAVLAYVTNVYTEVPVDPDWAVSGSDEVPAGAVMVRFTGTSTLLFSDGTTHWMVDGWFSRPGPLQVLFGKIGPDVEAIARGLAANEAQQLAAVIPVHSHYDHAMDAPEVARRTGAVLLGSEATANIGRGWGLPEAQMQVLTHRVPVQLGAFVITPIESRHFQFPDPALRERALGNPDVDAPLVPPVPTFDYRLGKAYILHVRHPKGSWLIVGSAGYEEGALQDLAADVVFLGVGGLGTQTDEYRATFWRETVAAVSPRRVIPIHYDSLTGPIEGPFTGPVLAAAFLSGGRDELYTFLKERERAQPGLRFQTLPRYRPVVLFQ
jgi:L-ascorbate metabolism protein UlaG (beta-lactamase superfamily)